MPQSGAVPNQSASAKNESVESLCFVLINGVLFMQFMVTQLRPKALLYADIGYTYLQLAFVA